MAYFVFFILVALAPVLGWADLQEELGRFFDALDSSANISASDIYQGQKAGYVTGGGATIKNRSIQLNPSTINLPKFDAGCGGIDIYTGGFSFINSEQLIDTLKSIGSSSIGYAFMLSLETISPQVANNIKQLQTWANAINTTNINSCEVAAQLVGSVWPADSMASQHICQSVGTHYGGFTDHVAGRHQCNNPEKRRSTSEKALESHPDLLTESYNVAWEAIKKQGRIMQDGDMARFLMTLMGTLVVTEDKVELYPAKASEGAFIKTLLEGGTLELYSCEDKKQCLLIESRNTLIDKKSSWGGKIEALLLSMQEKVLRDEELHGEEQELLVKTHLPLYRFINVLTAYKKGICPIDLKQVADIVSMDILVQYLRDSLESVRASCYQLKYRVHNDTKVQDYLDTLSAVERTIAQYEHRSSLLMDQEVYILEKMQLLEAQIASELCL